LSEAEPKHARQRGQAADLNLDRLP